MQTCPRPFPNSIGECYGNVLLSPVRRHPACVGLSTDMLSDKQAGAWSSSMIKSLSLTYGCELA